MASQNYQVTVMEIEELSGLEFADAVYETNPLFLSAGPAASAAGVTSVPERIDVYGPTDIVNAPSDPRIDVADNGVEVYLSAAMVASAPGKDEWVCIANLEPETVDLTGGQESCAGHRKTTPAPRAGLMS